MAGGARGAIGRAVCCVVITLAACAAPPPAGSARVLIFGEQHDQPDHQRQVADVVEQHAADGRLAAVVIEMAEQGRSTAALPRDADEAQARQALAWTGWPWEVYRPVVMAAVRAGVPVLGGNLPRERQRAAMADAGLDATVDSGVRQRIASAVRDGHCGLLPAAQEPAMVRIQIARDRAMAQTLRNALAAAPVGKAVLLLTGAQHASRDRGVPLHLTSHSSDSAGLPAHEVRVVVFGDAADLRADEHRPASVTARPDPCTEFAERLAAPKGASAPMPSSAGSAPGNNPMR